MVKRACPRRPRRLAIEGTTTENTGQYVMDEQRNPQGCTSAVEGCHGPARNAASSSNQASYWESVITV
jgi:hypothetical protein